MITLGLDGGGTATRWVLVDLSAAADGAVLVRGTVGPMSGHLGDPALAQATRTALADLVTAIRRSTVPPPQAVGAGITGVIDGTPAARDLAALLATALGVRPDRVHLSDDIAAQWQAAFGPGETARGGILVYSGTGSVACGRAAGADPLLRAGGHGYLIDDGGSGVWIAQHLLRYVCRQLDAAALCLPDASLSDPLVALVARECGARTPDGVWQALAARVYGGDPATRRGDLGAWARLAADPGLSNHGPTLAILAEAGRELARLADGMLRRFGPVPVHLTGRAALMHPAIRAGFEASLHGTWPQVAVTAGPLDAALAAARMAVR